MNRVPDRVVTYEWQKLAHEFYEAFRGLPSPEYLYRPRYFLACHAVELILKTYLLCSGDSEEQVKKKYGHSLKKLLPASVEMGLGLDADTVDRLSLLSDAHSQFPFLARYPRLSGDPIYTIEQFEPDIAKLFELVDKARV